MEKHLMYFLILITFILACSRDISNEAGNEIDNDKIIKVAILQISPSGANLDANLKRGEEFCRKAKLAGADIVLFPESWSTGYSQFHYPGTSSTRKKHPLSFEDWQSKAIDSNSNFIIHFRKLATELNMAIIITYLEKWKGLPRNSASVIDSNGNILMTYAKVHTCDFIVTEAKLTPGDDFFVCSLPIKDECVRIGIMICYDREFPESARILMLKGAELILTPNACQLEEERINQFQTRAVENAVGVAMANYPKPLNNGHSCAFDCEGKKILVSDEKPGIFIASFDMQKIRAYRKETTVGNAYRRPQKYHLLLSPEVDTVFIRNNGFGEKFLREKR